MTIVSQFLQHLKRTGAWEKGWDIVPMDLSILPRFRYIVTIVKVQYAHQRYRKHLVGLAFEFIIRPDASWPADGARSIKDISGETSHL